MFYRNIEKINEKIELIEDEIKELKDKIKELEDKIKVSEDKIVLSEASLEDPNLNEERKSKIEGKLIELRKEKELSNSRLSSLDSRLSSLQELLTFHLVNNQKAFTFDEGKKTVSILLM